MVFETKDARSSSESKNKSSIRTASTPSAATDTGSIIQLIQQGLRSFPAEQFVTRIHGWKASQGMRNRPIRMLRSTSSTPRKKHRVDSSTLRLARMGSPNSNSTMNKASGSTKQRRIDETVPAKQRLDIVPQATYLRKRLDSRNSVMKEFLILCTLG